MPKKKTPVEAWVRYASGPTIASLEMYQKDLQRQGFGTKIEPKKGGGYALYTKAWSYLQNPHRSIKALLRRLPSGEIQLKIPLSAKNVKAQVKAIRKALGRRVKSAVIVGGKIARKMSNPRRARRRKR